MASPGNYLVHVAGAVTSTNSGAASTSTQSTHPLRENLIDLGRGVLIPEVGVRAEAMTDPADQSQAFHQLLAGSIQLKCPMEFMFGLLTNTAMHWTRGPDVGEAMRHLLNAQTRILQGIGALRTAHLQVASDQMTPLLQEFAQYAGGAGAASSHDKIIFRQKVQSLVHDANLAFRQVSTVDEQIAAAILACCALAVSAALADDPRLCYPDFLGQRAKILALDHVCQDILTQVGLQNSWLSSTSKREKRLRNVLRIAMFPEILAVVSGIRDLPPRTSHSINLLTHGDSQISVRDLIVTGLFPAATNMAATAVNLTPWELRVAGFTAAECRLAGCTPKQLFDVGFPITHPGLLNTEVWPSVQSLLQGMANNIDHLKDLHMCGYTAQDGTVRDFAEVPFPWRYLIDAGFEKSEHLPEHALQTVATACMDARQWVQMHKAGVTAGVFKDLGFSVRDFAQAGFPIDYLVLQPCFTRDELDEYYFYTKSDSDLYAINFYWVIHKGKVLEALGRRD